MSCVSKRFRRIVDSTQSTQSDVVLCGHSLIRVITPVCCSEAVMAAAVVVVAVVAADAAATASLE